MMEGEEKEKKKKKKKKNFIFGGKGNEKKKREKKEENKQKNNKFNTICATFRSSLWERRGRCATKKLIVQHNILITSNLYL